MIKEPKIQNSAKYFSSAIFQDYLVFIPTQNTLNILVALLEFISENVMECKKKILEIQLNQTAILPYFFLIIFITRTKV